MPSGGTPPDRILSLGKSLRKLPPAWGSRLIEPEVCVLPDDVPSEVAGGLPDSPGPSVSVPFPPQVIRPNSANSIVLLRKIFTETSGEFTCR